LVTEPNQQAPPRANLCEEAPQRQLLLEHYKLLFGWIIDSAVKQTLESMVYHYNHLCNIFDEILCGAKCVPLKTWQKLLGKLGRMVLAIPSGRSLFSTLQSGVCHTDQHHVRINHHGCTQLDDFEVLAVDLHSSCP
jgi:hypothetical protein